jgi:cytochrome c oxidase subunit 3
MRRGLCWGTVLSLTFLVVPWFELRSLPFHWDTHDYGSVVWTTLCLHTMHGIIGSGENLMLLAVLFAGPVEEKLLVDVSVDGLYWYFIVITDALCYAIFDLHSVWGG